jgi:hypothetical protein
MEVTCIGFEVFVVVRVQNVVLWVVIVCNIMVFSISEKYDVSILRVNFHHHENFKSQHVHFLQHIWQQIY